MTPLYETTIFQQMSQISNVLNISESNGKFQFLVCEELKKSRKLPLDMAARDLIHAINTAKAKINVE